MSVSFNSNLGVILQGSEEAIAKAAKIIGGMAESYAKRLCPVDTGNLRNSITHTTERNNRTVVIGSSVVYAPFVELGTGQRGELSGGKGVRKGMRARPYMRPAIEKHADEYKAVLEQTLKG